MTEEPEPDPKPWDPQEFFQEVFLGHPNLDDFDDGEMLMPFVVFNMQSSEAHAFSLGWECGVVDRMLEEAVQIGFVHVGRYVHTQAVQQLDLIAMRHGLVMRHEAWEEDPHWTWVEFTNRSDWDDDDD